MRGGESHTKKQFANQAEGSMESPGLSSAIQKQFQPLSRHDLSKFFGRVSPAVATVLVMSKAVSLGWQHCRRESQEGQRRERGDLGKAFWEPKVV